VKRLILKSFQSPGDVVMFTAAVRDLHAACPGRFQTDVRSSADDLWLHNPHLTPLDESSPDVLSVDMHYPLIHQSNQRPYHFIHGYHQYLEQQLGLRVPVTQYRGDIHLSEEERNSRPPHAELGIPGRYWVLVAGGKYDFTAKWWAPGRFQQVVDRLAGRVHFVQCGEAGHWHPELEGVTQLVGRTTLRELVRLVYHADGVLSPVTLAMHLAAAVPAKPGKAKHRPCVVVAGGREPPHWEAYPHHQFIHTVGALPCCAEGGCWRSRCQLVGDGDSKDRHNLCQHPVQVSAELRIPRCMAMITPEEVVRRIELYYQGGVLEYLDPARGVVAGASVEGSAADAQDPESARAPNARPADTHNPRTAAPGTAGPPRRRGLVSVAFYHGLGDAANFARLIPLYARRGWRVAVECTPDKRILFRAAGAGITAKARHVHPWPHSPQGPHAGHGRSWEGNKPAWNISLEPLPDIGPREELWQEYCRTEVRVLPLVPAEDTRLVRRWLADLPRPIVLLHTKGNTAQHQKSLPDRLAAALYRHLLDGFEGSLVLLDWDNRVPRLDSWRLRHLSDFEGECSAARLFALMEEADLVVGVDSGPLHACGLARTPSVGIWSAAHDPVRFALPRPNQLNVVLAEAVRPWSRFRRVEWNLVEHPGRAYDPGRLAEYCLRMLGPTRYVPAAQAAADVVLREWIGRWCRPADTSGQEYRDRNHSFDVLFREIGSRFERPTIVETGTIRQEEDWPGAGFFTYLAGMFVSRAGGQLHSVDVDEGHCRFARAWCAVFGPAVRVHQSDSVAFLTGFRDRIDVLYLDSLDTDHPGHAEHALRELQAALPRLHETSLLVFDDTPWREGRFTGKGARAVPWLLQRGWKILYAGYQVVMGRTGRTTA